MTSPSARIRVGIVTWNVEAVIGRCLDSLPAALDGEAADVVVVDNASTDGTVGLLRARSGITLVENVGNDGYAKAMNRALAEPLDGGPPDVLVALNPDTWSPPGSIGSLARYLRAHPAAGLVVPRLLNPDGTEQHSVHRFPSPAAVLASALLPAPVRGGPIGRHYRLEGVKGPGSDSAIDWAIGAVHVLRAGAVGEKPYDERWFMYGEDLDLCWRLAAGGWERRIVPTVTVTHVGNVSGAAAWGAGRSVRVWEATHDWYRVRRGVRRAQIFAAANVLAVAWRGALAAGRRRAGRPVPPWDIGLRALLRVHARAVVGR